MTDEIPSDFLLDDADTDMLEEQRAAIDAQAASLLAQAWPDLLSDQAPPAVIETVAERIRVGIGSWPGDYFAPEFAEGLPPHADAREVWIDCAASTISPLDDPSEERGLDVEESALLASTVHADWLALVLGVVRRGVGAELTGTRAVADLLAMDELEGEVEDLDALESHFSSLVSMMMPRWQALGALDEQGRLSELGLWGLPRALHVVWDDPQSGEL
ncbi:hypothetical protein BJ980_001518 [Nocardioides daedukensis]|uniref:Uncharacterized protein n=1 Tax=Nocardioides daedukensis TaxID=634462 RepID=A0A7Y9S349_9ACTN|nr:hypothetical protein [Nocardioides daedukensis]NYG58595.1 hypothetical protein [Nocardioides daedukensis]